MELTTIHAELNDFKRSVDEYIAFASGKEGIDAHVLCLIYESKAKKGIQLSFLDTVYHDALDFCSLFVIRCAEDMINDVLNRRTYHELNIAAYRKSSRRRYPS